MYHKESIEKVKSAFKEKKYEEVFDICHDIIKEENNFLTLNLVEKLSMISFYVESCCELAKVKKQNQFNLYKEALEVSNIKLDLLSKNSLSVVKCNKKIAGIHAKFCWYYKEIGNISELQAHYDKACQLITQNDKDPLYQELREVYQNLCSIKADTAYQQKNFLDAIKLYQEATDILKRCVEKERRRDKSDGRYVRHLYLLADHSRNCAECFSQINSLAEAIELLKLAKSSYKKLIKIDSQKKEEYQKSLELIQTSIKMLSKTKEKPSKQVSEKQSRKPKRKQHDSNYQPKTEAELLTWDITKLRQYHDEILAISEKKRKELEQLKQEKTESEIRTLFSP